MYTKYGFAALCAAASLKEVTGAAHHRHNHPKRAMEWAATEVVVETDYVTVTVTGGAAAETTNTAAVPAPTAPTTTTTSTTPSSAPSSTPVPATSTSSSYSEEAAPAPTTLTTKVKPQTSSTEYPTSSDTGIIPTILPTLTTSTTSYTPTPTSSAAPTPTGGSSGTGKRGAAYNDASLVESLVSASSEITWAYNWGSDPSGLSANVAYYPMLWGTKDASWWSSSCQDAIDNYGSDTIMSFNEPDMPSQSNMSPSDAASAHIQYMNPFADQVRITTPAISSSENANQGLDWLQQWVDACAGGCKYDIVNAHWYGPGGSAGAQAFLDHIEQVHSMAGKPVWITEFGAEDSDANIDSFMSIVTKELDSRDYVEKYAYFMVNEGQLLSSATSLSSYGQIYAGLSTASI